MDYEELKETVSDSIRRDYYGYALYMFNDADIHLRRWVEFLLDISKIEFDVLEQIGFTYTAFYRSREFWKNELRNIRDGNVSIYLSYDNSYYNYIKDEYIKERTHKRNATSKREADKTFKRIKSWLSNIRIIDKHGRPMPGYSGYEEELAQLNNLNNRLLELNYHATKNQTHINDIDSDSADNSDFESTLDLILERTKALSETTE